MREEGSEPAQALAAVGVHAADVRSEIERAAPPGEAHPTGHIPFTPRAKKSFELALREALRLKHRTIEPEHILLGLLREGQGLAAEALNRLNPDVEALRQAVIQRMARWAEPSRFSVVPPDLPAMTRAGAAAFDRARQLAAGAPVGSQHVLRGLFGEEDGLAVQALAALGVTREAVERELERLDPTDTSDEPPEQAGARRTRLHVAGDVITMRLEDPQLASRLTAALQRLTKSPNPEVEVSGTEPEAKEVFGKLWRALERTSQELAGKVGTAATSGPPWVSELKPPGWSTRASVAGYTVWSMPDGPTGRLWTAEGIDEGEVRRFLARWLVSGLPVKATESSHAPACTFFTVQVGRNAEVVPGSPNPEGWTTTNFSFGPGPAPADWPRVPLTDLVAFAIADLEPRAAA